MITVSYDGSSAISETHQSLSSVQDTEPLWRLGYDSEREKHSSHSGHDHDQTRDQSQEHAVHPLPQPAHDAFHTGKSGFQPIDPRSARSLFVGRSDMS